MVGAWPIKAAGAWLGLSWLASGMVFYGTIVGFPLLAWVLGRIGHSDHGRLSKAFQATRPIDVHPFATFGLICAGITLADWLLPNLATATTAGLFAPLAFLLVSRLVLVVELVLEQGDHARAGRQSHTFDRTSVRAASEIFLALGIDRNDVNKLSWALLPDLTPTYRHSALHAALAVDTVGCVAALLSLPRDPSGTAYGISVLGPRALGLVAGIGVLALCASLTLNILALLRRPWAIQAKRTIALLSLAYFVCAGPLLASSAFGLNWVSAFFVVSGLLTLVGAELALEATRSPAGQSFTMFSLVDSAAGWLRASTAVKERGTGDSDESNDDDDDEDELECTEQASSQ